MARDPYKYFRIEARDLADQLGQSLLELERAGSGGEVVPRLLRLAHTLKGAARVVRQPEIADQAHTIEDLLGPYRDQATAVPRASIEEMLRLLDSISGKVAGLVSPEAQPAASAPAPAAAAAPASGASEEPARAFQGDVAEIDDLLEGVTEANTQLRGLRETTDLAGRASRLADRITEQLLAVSAGATPVAGPEGPLALAENLRGLVAKIEQGIEGSFERLERELREVRDVAEQLRLVPAGALFPNIERAARDTAQVLGKEVTFEGLGGDIRLDGQVSRIVQDALLQLTRNAVAHGIEAKRDRLAAGKPAAGRVTVSVLRRGRRVVFRCNDDGRGIDVPALREAAIRKGRSAAELDRLAPAALLDALLHGGISTSASVSEVAGRGIGMDLVRHTVARLGADLSIKTEVGIGTTFELSVPLSLSSVEALLLEAPGLRATVPLGAVRHTVRLEPKNIHRTSLGEAIIYDGRSVPLVPLGQLLGRTAPVRRNGSFSAVIVGAGDGLAALAVGRIPGTASIVFRSLPDLAPANAVVAGASFDADGIPLLMLDPEGVVAAASQRVRIAGEAETIKRPLLVIDDSLTTRMLEQSILESDGYDVDVAVSAEEGLERVRLRDYALILVDVEMPGMDGFTFIEHLRRDDDLRDIPAILVTSRNAPEDKRRGQDVGAQGYVVKSEFDQAELLGRIHQLVS